MSAPQHTSWEHKHTNKKKIKLEAIEEGIQHWPLPPHAFKPEHIPTRIPYTRTGHREGTSEPTEDVAQGLACTKPCV